MKKFLELFLSFQNGTLEMPDYFVAKIHCHNFALLLSQFTTQPNLATTFSNITITSVLILFCNVLLDFGKKGTTAPSKSTET